MDSLRGNLYKSRVAYDWPCSSDSAVSPNKNLQNAIKTGLRDADCVQTEGETMAKLSPPLLLNSLMCCCLAMMMGTS